MKAQDKPSFMKRSSTVFLQAVIVLTGVVALVLLLWEPQLEGRNQNATLFQIYFNDPFLVCAYSASIAFFVALYQAFKLLGYVGRSEVFTQRSVNALRNIKYCGLTLVAFGVAFEAWVNIFQRTVSDDIAGGVAIGLLMIFVSAVIATAAAVFERTLQSAVDMKSENDLTV